MEAYISGLERFVGWVEKYHPSHYTVKSIRNKARSLLAEEKSAPIHSDWKLREELGEYMDDLRNSASNDYADDLETILAKCPAVYFMEDRPTKPEAKQDDTAGLVEEVRNMNCDNVNCGKGAICNFCWIKNSILSRHQGETK